MQLEIAGLSDEGARRRAQPNEDSLLATHPSARLEDGALVAVADGVGGAAAGAEASGKAVQVLQDVTVGADPSDDLSSAFSHANEVVRELARSDRTNEGAATTLVAAYLRGEQLWIANVGDSRAYRLRAGRLEQLTIDHSYVQEEVDAGRLTAEEARTHRRRNVITRAIGVDPGVETDVFTFDVREGDVLILCSDGLSGPVTDPEIAWIVGSSRGRPQQTARALVKAANNAGGPDNVTAVVVRVGTRDLPRTLRLPPMSQTPLGRRIRALAQGRRRRTGIAAAALAAAAVVAVAAIVLASGSAPPTLVADSMWVLEDTTMEFHVLRNDRNVSDGMTVRIVEQPASGSAIVTDRTITYTPEPNFNGRDSLAYAVGRAEDDTAERAVTATVTITVAPVNDAPIANDDGWELEQDGELTRNVMSNDEDIDGDRLTVELITGPSHGELVDGLGHDGTFTYVPGEDFSEDSFTYTVSDGQEIDEATVSITVVSVNKQPIAVSDRYDYELDEVGTLTVGADEGVLANDSDDLTPREGLIARLLSEPVNLQLNSDGSFSYTPDPGFFGEDTFDYTVSDEAGLEAGAKVTITVTAAPSDGEAPPPPTEATPPPPPDPIETPTPDAADPTRPGQPRLVGDAGTELTLSWTASASDDVEFHLVATGDDPQSPLGATDGNTTTIKLKRLEPGRTYTFVVIAVDSQGIWGDRSLPSTEITIPETL